MEKEYLYRKHIRKMQYIMPGILLALTLIFWLFIGLLSLSERVKAGNMGLLLSFAGGFSFLFLAEAVLMWFALGRFTKIKVTINDEEIIYKNVKGEKNIAFDEITALKFPSIKYIGGWVKIVSGKENIRLTVVLENIGDFLLRLKNRLDLQNAEGDSGYNNRNLYDSKKFFGFYKTAVYADQSWDRVYEIFLKLIGLSILSSVIIGVMASRNDNIPAGLNGLLVSVAFVFPTIGYIISEVFFGRYLAKHSDKDSFSCPQRNVEYEKKVYSRLSVIFGILFGLVVILLFL